MESRIENIDSLHDAYVYTAKLDDLKLVSDLCQKMQNANMTGHEDMPLLGIVPNWVVMKYICDNGITYAQFMQNPEHATRLLNHSDNAYFRVKKGIVNAVR